MQRRQNRVGESQGILKRTEKIEAGRSPDREMGASGLGQFTTAHEGFLGHLSVNYVGHMQTILF